MVPFGEKGRATSAQAPVRSVAQDVAATVLGAEFQRMKEELERSRSEASRIARESERVQEKTHARKERVSRENGRTRSSCDFLQKISQNMPLKPLTRLQIDELNRTTAVQVTQARHLFDHVKLAERRIDEVDGEKQQYAAEVQRLRDMILSLEKDSENGRIG